MCEFRIDEEEKIEDQMSLLFVFKSFKSQTGLLADLVACFIACFAFRILFRDGGKWGFDMWRLETKSKG